MKITFIDKQTGIEITDKQFLIDDGRIWEYSFDSCDRIENATRMWNGSAVLAGDNVKAIIEL